MAKRNVSAEERERRRGRMLAIRELGQIAMARKRQAAKTLSKLTAEIDGVVMPFEIAYEELIQATLTAGRPGPDQPAWARRVYDLRRQMAPALEEWDALQAGKPPGVLATLPKAESAS